jgi:hypothetical protein
MKQLSKKMIRHVMLEMALKACLLHPESDCGPQKGLFDGRPQKKGKERYGKN